MALQGSSDTITVNIGTKVYTINVKKVPYFEAWSRSHLASGGDITTLTHDEIENFDVALTCITKGFRNSFRLLGTDLSRYISLCKTLDYLLIDVPDGQTLKDVSRNFRTSKGDGSRWLGYPSMKVAKDSAFRFLYMLHTNSFGGNDSSKVFEATLYVVSHRGPFKHNIRNVIREAYLQKFNPTAQQMSKLDEWPVYVDGKPCDSDEECTTSSPDEYPDEDLGSDDCNS